MMTMVSENHYNRRREADRSFQGNDRGASASMTRTSMMRTFNAGRRSYTITDRHGIVQSVERRAEKLLVNCGGSARSIEMQNALITAEDGNEWRMSTGASFFVQPGNKVSVIFAAVNGGAPHAGLVKNVDTGATWWWSMEPLLPNYRWFFAAMAMLLAGWIAIWSLAGESSRQLASYAILLSVALVSVGMAVRFVRRKALTSVLRTTMEGATH